MNLINGTLSQSLFPFTFYCLGEIRINELGINLTEHSEQPMIYPDFRFDCRIIYMEQKSSNASRTIKMLCDYKESLVDGNAFIILEVSSCLM